MRRRNHGTAYSTILKGGNKPSLIAAFANSSLGIIKGAAFFFTGNVAMFAEMMHSFGDAANQFFVYIGPALSKKAPTLQFPNGYGRGVNLVCLGAVLIVAILMILLKRDGTTSCTPPTNPAGLYIALGVLASGMILEGFVLHKAQKQRGWPMKKVIGQPLVMGALYALQYPASTEGTLLIEIVVKYCVHLHGQVC
ncbi:MAG: cation diffusion facilitator family transporter [Lysinibacillus sp.]